MSRELTMDEVRQRFFDELCTVVRFASKIEVPSGPCSASGLVEAAAEAAVFHTLSLLEGAGALPYFLVIPHPHPTDRAYHEGNDEDWYPEPPAGLEERSILRGEDHHEFLRQWKVRRGEAT